MQLKVQYNLIASHAISELVTLSLQILLFVENLGVVESDYVIEPRGSRHDHVLVSISIVPFPVDALLARFLTFQPFL